MPSMPSYLTIHEEVAFMYEQQQEFDHQQPNTGTNPLAHYMTRLDHLLSKQEQRELGISTYWTQVIVAGDQSHRWRYGAAAFSWYGHTWFLLRRNENSEETEWLLAELYPGSTMQATSYFRAIMPLTNVDPRHDLVTFLSSWLPTHESARARRPDGGRMEGDADQRPS